MCASQVVAECEAALAKLPAAEQLVKAAADNASYSYARMMYHSTRNPYELASSMQRLPTKMWIRLHWRYGSRFNLDLDRYEVCMYTYDLDVLCMLARAWRVCVHLSMSMSVCAQV